MSRRLSVLLSMLLIGQLVAVVDFGQIPARAACAETAADASTAAAMAKACGSRVEDESARTEYTQTFAEPDGDQKLEVSVVPQRARRQDGTWGKIDTSLRRVGDALAPVAAASSVRFSAGGTGPFASMTRGGKTFSLAWPYGALPAPSIQGDTATYGDVLPDVDLVVRATEAAFTHYLVVKTAKAKHDPRVRETRYQVGGDVELVSTAEGGLVAQAGDVAVATAEEPQMWDTPRHLGERELAMSGEQPPSRKYGRVAGRVAGKELVLVPEAALLDAGSLPVVIDPLWNPGQGQWAYATSNNTNAPMTDGKIAAGDPSPAAPILRSGDDTTGRLNRSFMRFDIGTVAYKQIVDANISGRVDHTWKCSVDYPNYFYRTAAIGATPRQAWPGPGLELLLGNNNVHANEDACNDPNMPFEVFSGTLTNDLQYFANNGWGSYYVGVCACSNSGGSGEGTTERWMRYFLNDFRLNIAFNTVPNMPDQLTVDGKACAAGSNRPAIKTATPTLRAHATDNDGDTMNAFFAYARWLPRDIPVRGDFTGDGKDDAAFWRPSDGNWNIRPSQGGADQVRQWGLDGDIPVTGDFNADGRTDALVWRPNNGTWYLSTTGGSSVPLHQWGLNGDFPVVGDFNGDNKDDTAVWRPWDVNWYVYLTDGSPQPSFEWGEAGDIPLAGDINGDNKDDAIIWRPSTGDWWVHHTDGPMFNFRKHGALGDTPFIGDFNNDGKDDLAYYRPSNHTFSIAYTGGGVDAPRGNWGHKQVLGDYNGDGKADQASFNADTGGWSVAYTGGSTSTLTTGFGSSASSWVDVGGGSQGSVPNNTFGQINTMPLADGGTYTFRSQTNDNRATSPVTHMPGNCEFLVDVTKPAVPTVVADVYKEGPNGCPGGACGAVGKTGRFTFSSSSDTQSFLYGFSDPPTTPLTPGTLGGSVFFDYTPTSSGAKTLYVRAIDRAGNESSKTFQFYVAAPTTALGRWLMNDPVGSTTLADDTGNGRTLTVLNGATLGQPGRIAPGNDGVSRSSGSFDGVDDAARRSAMIDTSRSFSISAWAKLDAKTGVDQTIVSQQGSYWSAFYLQYDASLDRWVIEAPTGETQTPTPNWYSAKSTSVPKVGVWTHLVGAYDPAAKQLKIYVNGVLEDTSTGLVAWNAIGEFRVGRSGSTWFDGSIAEVQVWDRMISDTEVFNLYDPVTNGLVAKWDMSDVGPGPTYDASPLVHDLEFYPQPGGPQIPPAGSGHTGTGLSLDGIDDNARTNEPVLYTDQSFTVSAWVNLATASTGTQAAISQVGTTESAFYLKYADGTGKWMFVYGDMEGLDTGLSVSSLGAATKGAWVHLVGVYDAQASLLKLYVNGALQETTTIYNPWNATGPVNIGRVLWRGNYTDYWAGSIDEVRIYQGAVTNIARIS